VECERGSNYDGKCNNGKSFSRAVRDNGRPGLTVHLGIAKVALAQILADGKICCAKCWKAKI
jgi:hypothetical protein